jgi:OCT family organic cation transporter-like MFS transporter 4/5
MEDKVERLFTAAGSSHRFQYLILALTFVYWINVDIIPISLPYLEKNPLVSYYNTTSGDFIDKVSLNYTICESGFDYYPVEIYNFSWTSEFGLECDGVIVAIMGSLSFTGSLVGAIIFPIFANNLGRKNTVFTFSLLFAALLISSFFIHNFYICLALLTINQVFSMLTCLSTFMNLNEITHMRLRSFFGSIINGGYCVCGIAYIFLFKLTDSWRWNFIISAAMVTVLGVVYMLVAIESPRYYLAKGNIDLFIEGLRKLAKKNDRQVHFENELNSPESDLYIEKLKPELEAIHKKKAEKEGNGKKQTNVSVWSLFTNRSINWVFFISCILWLTASSNYYGITINLKNLPGDVYINGILIYVFEILSYIFASFAINTKLLGRKGTIIFYEVIAVAGYAVLFFVELSDLLNVIVVFCCRFAVAGIFTILYTYSLEVYPTPVRAVGFGINSAAARVGSIACPFLIEIMDKYINLVFVSLNVICLILMFFMPETYGQPLMDNMPIIERKKKDVIVLVKEETLLSKD